MGNGTSIFARSRKDDSVSAGRATAVDSTGLEDGKLLIGPSDWEVEAFVVVVLVRVGATTSHAACKEGCRQYHNRSTSRRYIHTLLVVGITGFVGRADLGSGVGGAAARGCRLTLVEPRDLRGKGACNDRGCKEHCGRKDGLEKHD